MTKNKNYTLLIGLVLLVGLFTISTTLIFQINEENKYQMAFAKPNPHDSCQKPGDCPPNR
jgi:hypothetical protein